MKKAAPSVRPPVPTVLAAAAAACPSPEPAVVLAVVAAEAATAAAASPAASPAVSSHQADPEQAVAVVPPPLPPGLRCRLYSLPSPPQRHSRRAQVLALTILDCPAVLSPVAVVPRSTGHWEERGSQCPVPSWPPAPRASATHRSLETRAAHN